MRARGIVSNRVYDALACGALVVSDLLDEIPERLVESIEQKRASRGGRPFGSGGYGLGSKGAGGDANKDRIVHAAVLSGGGWSRGPGGSGYVCWAPTVAG